MIDVQHPKLKAKLHHDGFLMISSYTSRKSVLKAAFFLFIFAVFVGLSGCSEDSTDNSSSLVPPDQVVRIPVVVHVIHNGEDIGMGANISYAQIQSQITVLNEDFRRLEGSNGFAINSTGVDTNIEFYLAASGPDGAPLPEPGVHRFDGGRDSWPKGPIRNPIDTLIKPITIWPPEQYLNIWTVNFGGFVSRDLLGYAQFPSESTLNGLKYNEGSADTDGVVIGYKYFGSVEKGEFTVLKPPFNLGRTATHEVGHWLGLSHIWGDGDCTMDDYCNDTPAASAPHYGCDVGAISCGSVDMVNNYMDYSDDHCMNTFTADQSTRMRTVLSNSPRRLAFWQH